MLLLAPPRRTGAWGGPGTLQPIPEPGSLHGRRSFSQHLPRGASAGVGGGWHRAPVGGWLAAQWSSVAGRLGLVPARGSSSSDTRWGCLWVRMTFFGATVVFVLALAPGLCKRKLCSRQSNTV